MLNKSIFLGTVIIMSVLQGPLFLHASQAPTPQDYQNMIIAITKQQDKIAQSMEQLLVQEKETKADIALLQEELDDPSDASIEPEELKNMLNIKNNELLDLYHSYKDLALLANTCGHEIDNLYALES